MDNTRPHSDLIFCIHDSFTAVECDVIVDFIESNQPSFNKDLHRRSLDAVGTYVNCEALACLLENLVVANSPGAYELIDIISHNYDNVLTQVCNNLKSVGGIPYNGHSGYNLRKFEAGNKTNFHMDGTDSTSTSSRTLTVITFLNDDFAGGDLIFPVQNRIVSPKKGTTLCFPPYWTHPHSATPVDAPRYTINTWFREYHRGYEHVTGDVCVRR